MLLLCDDNPATGILQSVCADPTQEHMGRSHILNEIWKMRVNICWDSPLLWYNTPWWFLLVLLVLWGASWQVLPFSWQLLWLESLLHVCLLSLECCLFFFNLHLISTLHVLKMGQCCHLLATISPLLSQCISFLVSRSHYTVNQTANIRKPVNTYVVSLQINSYQSKKQHTLCCHMWKESHMY